MNKYIKTFIAVIIGFFVGIVLSEIIGIIGYFWLDRFVGIKYLSIYSALLFGIVSLMWSKKKNLVV